MIIQAAQSGADKLSLTGCDCVRIISVDTGDSAYLGRHGQVFATLVTVLFLFVCCLIVCRWVYRGGGSSVQLSLVCVFV